MIQYSNERCNLIFDPDRAMLISLTGAGKEYVSEPIPVFDVSLLDQSGKQVKIDASETTLQELRQNEHSFEAVYENDLISVTVSVEVSAQISWGLSMKTGKQYVAEWINYPKITVNNNLSSKPDGHKILWGFNEGVLVDSMEKRENSYFYREPEYPSHGLMGIYPAVVETQFMAYFNSEGGLYFGAHDREDCLKGVDFYRHENEGILLQFRHFCGCEFGETFCQSYPMVMDFFAGTWEDAAEIYRSWFEKNKSERFVRIPENPALPKWYGESPVVIAYPVRGRHDTDVMEPNRLYPYSNGLPLVEKLEKELNSKIMVLLMHWEGTAPWAPPVVWPPYGGEEELKKLIDALHEKGNVLGVYCSGIGWTIHSNLVDYDTTEQFEANHLQDEMCLSPEQTLPYSKICTSQRKGYDLCPARDFTVNIMKDQVEKMKAAGIDYIQLLDQNHGGTSYFCYGKKHGHPPVPGKWQVDAMKHLLEEATKDADGVLFGCESAAAQSYIPYLLFSDNRGNLNYFLGEHAPVYAYIFHEYLNNFMGNQVSTGYDNEKSPDSLLERLAYSFSAGDMLTLVMNDDGNIAWKWGLRDFTYVPEQEPVKQLVRNLNGWRQGYGKQYLHTGKMVKGFDVSCDENLFYFWTGGTFTRKKLHTRAWQSETGTVGQFLINYNKEDVECTVSLPEETAEWVTLDGTRQLLPSGTQTLTIPALSAVLIETAGERSLRCD